MGGPKEPCFRRGGDASREGALLRGVRPCESMPIVSCVQRLNAYIHKYTDRKLLASAI